MTQFEFLKIALFSIILTFLAGNPAAHAQKSKILKEGKADYEWSCQACHGTEGKGDGEMAAILVMPPTDLTKISKNNNGKFPFWRIFEIISGQKKVQGHQGFQMPQFWARFQRDEDKPGYYPAEIRILVLTHYVESLQE